MATTSTGFSSKTSTVKQSLLPKIVYSQIHEELKEHFLSNVKEVGKVQSRVQAFQGKTTPGTATQTQTLQRCGAYGAIIDLSWNGKKCVGKKLHAEFFTQDSDPSGMKSMLQNFYKEIKILSRLNHDNIVNFFGLYHKSSGGYSLPVLVMERMELSLTDCIKLRKKECASKSNAILSDVAKGLLYLHEGGSDSPLAHRDLTSNNILLSSSFRAKIADFGSARMLDVPSSAKLTVCPGTPDFMPPEALEDPPRYTVKVDIFSFGCVVVHLEAGQWPNPAGPIRYGVLISEFERRKKWIAMMGDSHSLLPIVTQCLENDMEKRPSSYDLLNFLKKTRTSSSGSCASLDDIPSSGVAVKNAGEEKTAENTDDDISDHKPAATHETEETTPRKESTNKISCQNRLVALSLALLFAGLACILAGVLVHVNMGEQEMSKVAPDLPSKKNASQVVFNSWITANQSNQLLTHDNQTLPVIVTLSNFTKKNKNKTCWYSDPFYAFTGGHKMCTSVCANGINNAENTHISVFLHLMKGPRDDDLQQSGHWPLRGTFTIELLNQMKDENHYTRNVTFNSTTPEHYTNRVQDSGKPSIGWGEIYFITQNAILRDNYSYLMNNKLYLRIYFEPERFENGYSFNAKEHLLSSLISASLGLVLFVVVKYLDNRHVGDRTIQFVIISFMTSTGISVMRHFIGGLLWGAITFAIAFGCMYVGERIKSIERMKLVYFALGFPLGNVLAQFILVDILRMPWGILWWLI